MIEPQTWVFPKGLSLHLQRQVEAGTWHPQPPSETTHSGTSPALVAIFGAWIAGTIALILNR